MTDPKALAAKLIPKSLSPFELRPATQIVFCDWHCKKVKRQDGFILEMNLNAYNRKAMDVCMGCGESLKAALEASDDKAEVLKALKARIEAPIDVTQYRDFLGNVWLKKSDVLKLIAEEEQKKK